MKLPFLFVLSSVLSIGVQAQFVNSRNPDYHKSEPGLYTEDPFIVKYRKEYFAVFQGDFKRFRAAHAEIKVMVEKNPKDARAMVWFGNGQMVEAGLASLSDKKKALEFWKDSSKTLDNAVALTPEDPNIYMMRAATLIIAGEKFPTEFIDKTVWTRLRDDCEKFIKYIGPDRMPRTSIHLRGEAYGCLGVAQSKLGEHEKAKRAFEMVIKLNPGTDYEKRAKAEIEALQKKD
jgi:tetratricopeptide (TPR) repeat protein